MRSVSEFNIKLGRRLKAARTVLGYSLVEAADVIGVTVKTWRRWEGGEGAIRFDYVVWAVAEKFDINYMWLAYDESRFLPETEWEKEARWRAMKYTARGFAVRTGTKKDREFLLRKAKDWKKLAIRKELEIRAAAKTAV